MKKKISIQYKLPSGPWVEYDWTVVLSWAEIQEWRMMREFPNAEYRRVSK